MPTYGKCVRRRIAAVLLILALAGACSEASNAPSANDATTSSEQTKSKPTQPKQQTKPTTNPNKPKPKPNKPESNKPTAVKLPNNCYDVLSPDAAKAALRRNLPGRVIYVKNVAIKSIKRTGRVTCSYGPAPGKDPMLQVGVSAYETKSAAGDRVAVTVQGERDAGAQVKDATVRGNAATILLGQNGSLLVAQRDRITLAVSIDKGAKVNAQRTALINVAKTVLGNV